MKEKKISVKHFLNKKLKAEDPNKGFRELALGREGKSKEEARKLSSALSEEEGPFYKVYTRVNYRQKTTQFRSRIYDNILSEYEFNQAFKTKSGKIYKDLELESNQIVHLLRLTNSDANEMFDLSNLSDAYDVFRKSRIADLIIEEFEMEFRVALGRSEFAPLHYNINFEKSITTLIENFSQVSRNLNVKTKLDDFVNNFDKRMTKCFQSVESLVGKDYPRDFHQFVERESFMQLLYNSEESSILILRKRIEVRIAHLIEMLSGVISNPRFESIQRVVDEAI
ncbi:MAG: hypothetical protein ABJQ86_10870, partial [Cyclobacteriaceae bacterium]